MLGFTPLWIFIYIVIHSIWNWSITVLAWQNWSIERLSSSKMVVTRIETISCDEKSSGFLFTHRCFSLCLGLFMSHQLPFSHLNHPWHQYWLQSLSSYHCVDMTRGKKILADHCTLCFIIVLGKLMTEEEVRRGSKKDMWMCHMAEGTVSFQKL